MESQVSEYNATISIEDQSVIGVQNNKIIGLKQGSTKFLFNIKIGYYSTPIKMEVNVNVIGVKSDKYEINEEDRTIDCNNMTIEEIQKENFDVDPVGEVIIEDDKLKLVVDDEVVEEYTLINVKENENEQNGEITNNLVTNNEKATTTRKNTISLKVSKNINKKNNVYGNATKSVNKEVIIEKNDSRITTSKRKIINKIIIESQDDDINDGIDLYIIILIVFGILSIITMIYLNKNKRE